MEVLTFWASGFPFAADLREVEEVLREPNFSLPKVILAEELGFGGFSGEALVVGGESPFLVVVDEVDGVTSLSPAQIYPLPTLIEAKLRFPWIWALAYREERVLWLVDLPALVPKGGDADVP
ncbi:MAG TPA: hypothetical protein EYP17_11520 [Candidatus Latescibacteria bacterium]|nr:hypothetical protein [Candidatus Latescibacterota bacterium]